MRIPSDGEVVVNREGLIVLLNCSGEHFAHLATYKFVCGCTPSWNGPEATGLSWTFCDLWRAFLREQEAAKRLHEAQIAHNQLLRDMEKKVGK
jgi:hypothetical protein